MSWGIDSGPGGEAAKGRQKKNTKFANVNTHLAK